MNKNKRYMKKDIFKIKNHINRIFPYANKIDVKLGKLPNGLYRSSIKVIAPNKNILIANKKDECSFKALFKSYLAITKQAKKFKAKFIMPTIQVKYELFS